MVSEAKKEAEDPIAKRIDSLLQFGVTSKATKAQQKRTSEEIERQRMTDWIVRDLKSF